MTELEQVVRMAEALLFAAVEPLDEKSLATRLPEGVDVEAVLLALSERYENSGVTLSKVAGGWSFRTAPDLAFLLEREKTVVRRLSKAAVETLAIVAYHQPITRTEIEEVRGVALSKGTVDLLMEAGWVGIRGRKRTPGRPVTYGTTDEFLNHFGLEKVEDLPGLAELKATGLLSREPPTELFAQAESIANEKSDEKVGLAKLTPDDEGTDQKEIKGKHSQDSNEQDLTHFGDNISHLDEDLVRRMEVVSGESHPSKIIFASRGSYEKE